MVMKAINKTLLTTLGLALTLGLSACTGCSSNGWSTSASSSSSGSSETTYEIKWFNYGNILLYSEQVREGELPVYRGNTPTRPETAKSIFTFEGWTPEIVPATQDATYKAVYSSVTKTYTVTFAGGNCTCEYSQTTIENVPYGSKINVIGNRSIEINGTTVTVELTPTPSEQIIYQYSYDGWNVEDGDLVKEDMTISAVFKTSSTLYNIRLMASGGGELYATYNGYDTYSGSDIFIPNAKAYVGYIAGQPIGELVPAGNIALETVVNGIVKYLVVEPRTTSSEFYHYVIDGWYYNGEPLRYGVELYGDVMIEARFKEEPNNDYAQYFEFEINTMTNDATIIGATERVQYCDFEDLIIPKTYEGYRITGIKSDVLTQFRYSNCLYIPNTLMYIEEGTQESTYIYPRFSAPNKIVVEDGSTSFRMIEGVLYDYEITTVFAGTIEMMEYLEQKVIIFIFPKLLLPFVNTLLITFLYNRLICQMD